MLVIVGPCKIKQNEENLPFKNLFLKIMDVHRNVCLQLCIRQKNLAYKRMQHTQIVEPWN